MTHGARKRKKCHLLIVVCTNTWFEIWNEIINAQRINLSNKAIKRGQEIGIVKTNERPTPKMGSGNEIVVWLMSTNKSESVWVQTCEPKCVSRWWNREFVKNEIMTVAAVAATTTTAAGEPTCQHNGPNKSSSRWHRTKKNALYLQSH